MMRGLPLRESKWKDTPWGHIKTIAGRAARLPGSLRAASFFQKPPTDHEPGGFMERLNWPC
jgi:hypothetical protein